MKPTTPANNLDTARPCSAALEQNGLLQTKLFMPPLRPSAIPRSHLIERLNAGVDARLILVTAPAGFGKTTLVAQWLAGAEQASGARRAAWLQLEDVDSDVVRFWCYAIAALQTVDAGLDTRAMPADAFTRPPEAWLPDLLNKLASGPQMVLVLDDYHHIRSPAVHQSLNYFLHHAPPNVQVALVGRADPPLPLARLRVQQELLELRAADLSFTPREIDRYLNGALKLGLAAADIARLARRTEGWPAGVYLAARSLRDCNQEARRAFVQSFSGSNRHILHYLLEEVLQFQAPDVRDFLLRTSLLSRLSAPLCAMMTDRPEAAAAHMLVHLADAHLFITPLDPSGRWYRYHPLFAEALATQIRENDPDLWGDLHRRASVWYGRNGHAAYAPGPGQGNGTFDASGDEAWDTGAAEVGLQEELTPREAEILSLVARGASNQEIADQLVLSVGTVKGHVNHVFSKLGVHNRTAAVARARELGLLAS